MASIINASTTSGLTMTSDLSGVLQLQNNGVAIPPLTVAPAFSAYPSAASQTIATGTSTKVQVNIKVFDTNTNFDTSNYRFTPTVAGYYFFQGSIGWGGNYTYAQCQIFKNGSLYTVGPNLQVTGSAVTGVSSFIYCNGSTDYVELYCAQYSGSNGTVSGNSLPNTYFNGFMVRSA